MMIYILLGLFAGAVFGIGVMSVYGVEALPFLPWLDAAFLSFIGAGVVLQIIDNTVGVGRLLCLVINRSCRLLDAGYHASSQQGKPCLCEAR